MTEFRPAVNIRLAEIRLAVNSVSEVDRLVRIEISGA